mgnify:CR=1 FL=1
MNAGVLAVGETLVMGCAILMSATIKWIVLEMDIGVIMKVLR